MALQKIKEGNKRGELQLLRWIWKSHRLLINELRL